MTQEHDAAEVGALLFELASREPVPALSYDAVLRGGRRRRARRRAAMAAGAAALTAAAAAVGMIAARPDLGPDASRGPANRPAAAVSTTRAPVPTTPSAASFPPAAHDPMTPTARKVIAHGTDDQGRHWQVTARLWYAPSSREQALQQLIAVWQDEGDRRPGSKPDMRIVPESYHQDHVQTSVWVDGVRNPAAGEFYDADLPGIAPEHLKSVPAFVYEEGKLPWDGISASCAGWTKSETYPAVVAVGYVRPDITKVTVRWSNGKVEHPALVAVGESPDHFFALSCHPNMTGVISGYDRHGTELLRSSDALRGW